jgi:hypothetical protein
MTTEVIVYRNPGEQAIWNMLMGPVGMWLTIIAVSLIVGALVYVLVEGFAFKRKNKVQWWLYNHRPVIGHIATASIIGTFVAIAYPIW